VTSALLLSHNAFNVSSTAMRALGMNPFDAKRDSTGRLCHSIPSAAFLRFH